MMMENNCNYIIFMYRVFMCVGTEEQTERIYIWIEVETKETVDEVYLSTKSYYSYELYMYTTYRYISIEN